MSFRDLLENYDGIKNDLDVYKAQVCRVFNIYTSYCDQSFDSEQIKKILPDFYNVQSQESDDLAKLDAKLNQIFKSKRGVIGKQPFNSFLSSIPPSSLDEKLTNMCFVIQAKLLLLISTLNEVDDFSEIIKDACRAYRLLITKKNWDFLIELPDFTLASEHVFEQLNNLDKESGNSTHIKYFTAIFNKYIDPKYISKNSNLASFKSPKLKNSPKVVDVLPKDEVDEIDSRYKEYRSVHLDGNEYNIDLDERVSDQTSSSRFLSFDSIDVDEIKRSLTLQNQHAKTALNHIYRREKKLVTDPRNITYYDVSILVKSCLNSIELSAEFSYALFSLFTGKSLSEILLLNEKLVLNNKDFQEWAVIRFEHTLPSHEFKYDKKINIMLESLIGERPKGEVLTFLPEVLKKGLLKFPPSEQKLDVLKANVSTLLSKLNKKNSSNLSLSRIQNYLSFSLNRIGVDPTEIALILGRNTRQNPGCYYFKLNVSDLIDIHQHYMQRIWDVSGIQNIPLFDLKSSMKVGSQLQIKKEKIKILFKEVKSDLEYYRSSGWSNYQHFHNLYVIYCIHVLNISTGHRPVCNPYETISIFNFHSGTIFISDKESRIQISARVLHLPELAIQQVKAYVDHLKNIQPFITDLSDESGNSINEALTGEYPLFFFIYNNKMLPVEPGRLEFFMRELCPLPLNWHRHFMRTFLRRSGFSGQWVDAWMGHGESSFERFSGLAMQDLQLISRKINEFLVDEVDFSVAQGWDHSND